MEFQNGGGASGSYVTRSQNQIGIIAEIQKNPPEESTEG